jgi:hypothetical protein
MAYRTTKADVRNAFEQLCKAMGKSTDCWLEDRKARVGAWYLDYAPCYGGYIINEMANEGGGVRHPTIEYRVSGQEFVRTVRFVLALLSRNK